MKIGIRVPCPEPGVEIDPAVVAVRAEILGFDSIWYPEHAVMPVHTTTRFTWSGSADGSIPPAYATFVDPLVALWPGRQPSRRGFSSGPASCCYPSTIRYCSPSKPPR